MHRHARQALLLFMSLSSMVLVLALVSPRQAGATCTYTVVNTNDSGIGSLRQAILNSNGNNSGSNSICFDIPGGTYQTILIYSMLMITRPVTIDGTTQPGYAGSPVIELDGANAGSGTTGMDVTGGGTTIKSLVVNRFGGDGIILNNNGGNTVTGNYVGTNSAGTAAYPNGASGIGIASPNNVVGGITPAARNIVSGNTGTGIAITGTTATGNVVEGNYMGTDPSGTVAIGNGADGFLINDAPNNTIGGTTGVSVGGDCTGACNLSSGNGSNGFGILGSTASGNVVEGNYAGTNVHGLSALPNQNIGFEAQDAPNNTIGGTTPVARNIFSGNFGAGVSLTSTYSTGNVVEGNYIGVDVTGQNAMPNHKMGVNIGSPSGGTNNASDNTIGGTTGVTTGGSCTGACNVISSNEWSGIYITGSDGGANSIVGNFIGPSASGGLNLGNQQDGVGIVNSPNNYFGGPAASARNVVAGNGGNGFAIVGSSSTGTRIEGNYIGEATDGGCMPNTIDGVVDESALDVAIIGNNIFCSGNIGIDLNNNGVTANHQGGAVSGANELQNYPAVSAAYPSGSNTVVNGTLNSDDSTSYRVDAFSSAYCDRTGHGQGQSFLGDSTVTTDSSGNASFQITASGTGQGRAITTTATKIISGTPWETSEFSTCTYTPYQHPDGTVIRPAGSSNLFMLVNGQVSSIGSVAVLYSYGITPSQIKEATTADTNLSGTSSLYFRDGTLLEGSSSSNIYVVDETSPGTYVKRLISSLSAFNGLGYTPNDVIQVNDSVLPSSNGTTISDASLHPDGTLVKNPNNSSVYLVLNGDLSPVETPAVLTSLQYASNLIKAATNGDLSLTAGPAVPFREGSLVQPAGSSSIYAIGYSNSAEDKLQIGSGAVLEQLGYVSSDIVPATAAEIAAIASGPAL